LDVLKSAIRDFDLWKGLKSAVFVVNAREVNGKTSYETKYLVSSKQASAEYFLSASRSHWGIENGLHWILDTAFREDDHRLREGHAPENLSAIRRMALSLLNKLDLTIGIKNKRHAAGFSNAIMEQVLAVFTDDLSA
jgi:predicted transposase YbfD/YdcC